MVVRKMKGGALNHMPAPTKLTAPSITNERDLQKFFRFYSIVGHGAIEPRETGRLFLVPERTYIMFTARAGEPTEKIKPKVDAILNEFRYKQKDTSKASGLEDDASWFKRTFDTMENGSLFKDLLYDLKLNDNTKRLSIYQPGDLIQDLTMKISNSNPPWDPVGIWELPMDPRTEDYLQSTREDFNTIKEKFYSGEGKQLVDDIKRYFDEQKSQATINATLNPSLQSEANQINQILTDMENMIVYSHRLSESEIKTFVENKIPEIAQRFMEDHPLMRAYILSLNKMISRLAQENMIAQTAFDDQPKNLLSLLSYTGKIDNRRVISVYNLITNLPSIQTNGTSAGTYPVYRFFLFDICRSLQEKPYPVAKRLVRSLSNVMRFPNAQLPNTTPEVFPKFNTLLKLTKDELKALVSTSPQNAQQPTIQTLLSGQPVTYRQLEQLFGDIEQYEGAFEEFIKYHRFDKGDEAIAMFDIDPPQALKHLNGNKVVIDSVVATSKGAAGRALYYKVKDTSTGKTVPIFNRFLWKSLEDYANAIEEREDIVTSKKLLNTAYAEEEAKEKAEEEFDKNILHFVAVGKIVNIFKMGDTVKIGGISAPGPIHFNDLKGIIVGNDIKQTTTSEVLRYKVSIISPGQYYSKEQAFPHNSLTKVTAGGKHKTRHSKKSKQRRTRRN